MISEEKYNHGPIVAAVDKREPKLNPANNLANEGSRTNP